MPFSALRNSTTIADLPIAPTPIIRRTSSSSSTPPEKKRKMTITQTYFLAHTARGKLSSEAARSDHNLRLLVGHANLLDFLTLDLQEAEREQDAWFEKTVADARKPTEPKRVQWSDRVAADAQNLDIPDSSDDEEDSDADSDASDDEDDEDVYAEANAVTMQVSPRRAKSPAPVFEEDDEDEDMYDDEEQDNTELSLTRVASRSSHASISPPPELVHDHSDSSDSDEEEEEDETSPVLPAVAPVLPIPQANKDMMMSQQQRQPCAVAAY